ncbi:helix-turn-helix transcriptional regulator [Rhodococcus sp. IEGM 1366]|uniref:helix-turn-helix transcriptional regulator n=1 Tax=Rhodococcus sp. IEGM 1366 TaxID=3082223 RepID=UPI00295442C5|nr:helix-turn-helix transcriptional regulator [Rhodococcus sp. IEGM 1366]MDV8066357.1 helix-turn-helix transcriptional regulator [Rhodococcus sp. IEGM 1366]
MTATDARTTHGSRSAESGLEQNGHTYTEQRIRGTDFFSCLWTSTSSAAESTPTTIASEEPVATHRIIPDLCADFIVDSTGKAWLVGPATVADLVTTAPGVTRWGVRINPPALRSILGTDAEIVQDTKIDFGDVLSSRQARILADALRSTRVDATLLENLWPSICPDDTAQIGYAALTASPEIRVREVASDLGVSERHFRRTIAASTGLSPKTIQRVQRMQNVLMLARGTNTSAHMSLANLAVHAGYADQAHLSRDVQALTGVTPTQLLREHRR